jgi:hypothetical protein
MKPQATTLLSASSCSYIFKSGRRCRFPALPGALFCLHHVHSQIAATPVPDVDLSRDFGPDPLNFKSACEVNDFLCSLARLMIENRISARRASVLAYIASLELRTLPAIDHELGTDPNDELPRIVFDRPEPLESQLHANVEENACQDAGATARLDETENAAGYTGHSHPVFGAGFTP